MKKRFWATLLASAMVITMAPITSRAIDKDDVNGVVEQSDLQSESDLETNQNGNDGDLVIGEGLSDTGDVESSSVENLEENQPQIDDLELVKNEFVSDEKGIRYNGDDGNPVRGERKINNYLYCFDEEGYLKLGFQEHSDGRSFYVDSEPYLVLNVFQETEDGIRYFDDNGLMVVGVKKIQSKWYYFEQTGVMYKGWRTDGNKKYYYNDDGTLAMGVKKIGSQWYYFKGNGDMYKGWRTEGSKRYYYNDDGTLAMGVKKIDSKWYYFKGNGDMYKGWRTEGSKKYYYNDDGILAVGAKKIGSSWYYFNSNGEMYKGWRTDRAKKYYYDPNGILAIGAKKIGSSWYYFNKNGVMHTGWRYEGRKTYYYNRSGKLQMGLVTIDGNTYYFNKNGVLAEDSKMCAKAQQYSSKTKWMILVDTRKNRVGVYSGLKGDWDQKYYWKCTTGAKSTPTVKGQFTVGIKGKVFGKGYSCWYYTQFYGDYLFHSIKYNPGSMTSVQDGRLGINASHGCVRLNINNAKWIYNNIPKGSKVVVY